MLRETADSSPSTVLTFFRQVLAVFLASRPGMPGSFDSWLDVVSIHMPNSYVTRDVAYQMFMQPEVMPSDVVTYVRGALAVLESGSSFLECFDPTPKALEGLTEAIMRLEESKRA